MAASIRSDYVIKNFEILNKTRLLVGFYLGIYDEKEVTALVERTKRWELNSTLYTNPESRLTNARFRLEILMSFLKGGSCEHICSSALREVTEMHIDYVMSTGEKTNLNFDQVVKYL